MSFSAPPVIIVSGASRGLGRGIALHLAAHGCSVAINYCGNRVAADECAQRCRSAALSADQLFIPIQADISAPSDRRTLVEETLRLFGRIDGLVNNAGIAPKIRADLLDTTEASFAEVLRVNLEGPHFLTQEVARYWLKTKPSPRLPHGFQIVFVTSISADTASPSRGEYCISKAGLSMSGQLWAARLAPEGMHVAEIRPGIMATDMTAGVKEKYDALIAQGLVPQRRWGSADDVGRAVSAVIAGHFPYSSGAILSVDGGFHLHPL